MDRRTRTGSVRFEPAHPASARRRAVAFLLGALVWAAALWLALVLLGHTYILRRLFVVTAASWVFFALFLAAGIVLRRRKERTDGAR